jgi:hypothetical protein
MNTLREAAQQAEDVLRGCLEHPDAADAIAALQAALTEPEPYDQTALELCDTCGWKTLIPTEGCLNCDRQPKAEQEPVADGYYVMQVDGYITKIWPMTEEQALVVAAPQPKAEQEPVGYWDGEFSNDGGATLYEVPQVSAFGRKYRNVPLYTAPQPRKRLTDEDIDAIYIDHRGDGGPTAMCEQFARAIEAAVWGDGK